MTKFTINKGRDNEVKVDADTTQVSDGRFCVVIEFPYRPVSEA